MAHYVQYHNADRMGYPCHQLSGDEFWIVTRKFVSESLLGNQIWLIGGEGQPRDYSLCEVFVVAGIDLSDNPDFRFRIWGDNGIRFRPTIDMTHLTWFSGLKKALGNFRYGLTEIDIQYADYLVQIAQRDSEKYREAQESGWLIRK